MLTHPRRVPSGARSGSDGKTASKASVHRADVAQISFACLSNTLLLTVLVAILSNTFATINADAAAESMFRKAVSTLEGVKSGR